MSGPKRHHLFMNEGEEYSLEPFDDGVWVTYRDYETVARERDRLQQAAGDAAHALEHYRHWAGMDWKWTQGHPIHVEKAWDFLRAALEPPK